MLYLCKPIKIGYLYNKVEECFKSSSFYNEGKIKKMIDTSAFQGKTAAYYTLGCKLNFSETSTFGKMLQKPLKKSS